MVFQRVRRVWARREEKEALGMKEEGMGLVKNIKFLLINLKKKKSIDKFANLIY